MFHISKKPITGYFIAIYTTHSKLYTQGSLFVALFSSCVMNDFTPIVQTYPNYIYHANSSVPVKVNCNQNATFLNHFFTTLYL